MSLFNNKSPKSKTNATNLAGGEAFSQSIELEFISLVLTSMLQGQFYRSDSDQLSRLRNLLQQVDPKFAAKTAIFARNEFGMRSITHVVAAEIAHLVKSEPWTKKFYYDVVFRVDDITEIVSYYLQVYGKPLPNSLKKGLSQSFAKFDEYQLAKYRASKNEVSLVDVVNLIHPKPGKNAEAFKKLVEGKLRQADTWESRLTAAKTQIERAEVWSDLLKKKKLGYFALLRNLRNIMTDAPEMIDEACEQLTNEDSIRKSLVLPFRYSTAIEMISQIDDSRTVVDALSDAVDISAKNCPTLDGKTLIAIDTSGSMSGRPSTIATLFGAMLYKNNPNSKMVLFDDQIHKINPNSRDSIISIARSIPFNGGGTNFHVIFDHLGKKDVYDRIIILSDMQAWMVRENNYGYYGSRPETAYIEYKKRTGADPLIYSFDLAGYGTLEFPEKKVTALAGFSEKVFDLMVLLESGKSLVDIINSFEIAE